MNNLTKQFGRMEVNHYKHLQHGLKNALAPLNPPKTPTGVSYTSYKATQNTYPSSSYYSTVFSSNKKSRKNRKATRKNRKATRKQRKERK
jgi:hypothetical protein